jgi:uncharacterized OsmC-like protein
MPDDTVATTDAERSIGRYEAKGRNFQGGAAEVVLGNVRIAFDGTATPGSELPGPADLMAAALAACILKNVERFSKMMPFAYRIAAVAVVLERQESPPRIVRARYELRLQTEETQHRIDLLHRNILRFGTITNTLAAACDLRGEIIIIGPAERV